MPLHEYQALLRAYYQTLDGPHEGRAERLKGLVAEMDRLWTRMGERDRNRAVAYARELYEARLAGGWVGNARTLSGAVVGP
jgi:hypothetical protein